MITVKFSEGFPSKGRSKVTRDNGNIGRGCRLVKSERETGRRVTVDDRNSLASRASAMSSPRGLCNAENQET